MCIRDSASLDPGEIPEVLAEDQNFPAYYWMLHGLFGAFGLHDRTAIVFNFAIWVLSLYAFHGLAGCLLYTSDAADERSSVDLGGRRIIKKKKKQNITTDRHRSTKEK